MKKFLKIMLAFTLALGIVMSFAACGDDEQKESILDGKEDSTTVSTQQSSGEYETSTCTEVTNGEGLEVGEDTDDRFGELHTVQN